jgi:site-specific DNA-methyltransferase (adenine-specific)
MEKQTQNPQLPQCAVTSSVFCQDNLELLKSQPDESVDLIYCDILYGTGRNFGDYQDLKPIRSEIEAHYLPRLKEMHRVLKSTGSIYLQMDTKINHWLRCIMDDIFGYERFLNEKIWCYSTSGCNKHKWTEKHDHILYYSKTIKRTWNIIMDTKPSPLIANRRRSIETQNGRYNDGIWVVDVYPKDWIEFKNVQINNKEYVNYATQKPKALIERIIRASSNEGDLVADFYLGSGTTAVVCKELNRNFIGCDINPKAIEVTKNRLRDVNLQHCL